jgi:2-polyprenyl-6-methoxyphenol hydroxylase-like FAD-dependent oxidoreductase
MTPILVVGAGPVGLTMASELSRFGVGVRIIDQNPHPTKTSRALVIWSRTLELMDRMGCTRTFLDAGLRAHGASMRAGQVVLGRPRFDDIASEYNFALMIPQRDTERLLIQHLRTLGVEVERQVELLSFVQRDDCVETVLSHPDGRRETALTPWLIGCDGAHSAVRHGLNVEFRGSAQGDEWMIADVRLAGESAPPRMKSRSTFIGMDHSSFSPYRATGRESLRRAARVTRLTPGRIPRSPTCNR